MTQIDNITRGCILNECHPDKVEEIMGYTMCNKLSSVLSVRIFMSDALIVSVHRLLTEGRDDADQ